MTGWLAANAASVGVWGALAMVLFIPALEAALPLIGVVVPGQTAVVVGGILAYHQKVPLAAILVAALAGAVAGNFAGYLAGRRWQEGLLHRIPARWRKPGHTDRALLLIAGHSGKAVLIARFTAVLRTLVPALCGMSGTPLRGYLVWSTVAGALWAPVCVALGFAAAPALPL